ncbi:hypothetical protein BN2476_200092 [Paraburkholderia piptadeniae]|uniref:Uncharacterized protein n=1 Tax=Paraburkholderia piptadeniae TaxID=1701573 RepID=A0A1N7RW65_9BURK|nr:hypothetical protein BN2476_200092 [Paraburkholderia piptadeniae]
MGLGFRLGGGKRGWRGAICFGSLAKKVGGSAQLPQHVYVGLRSKLLNTICTSRGVNSLHLEIRNIESR